MRGRGWSHNLVDPAEMKFDTISVVLRFSKDGGPNGFSDATRARRVRSPGLFLVTYKDHIPRRALGVETRKVAWLTKIWRGDSFSSVVMRCKLVFGARSFVYSTCMPRLDKAFRSPARASHIGGMYRSFPASSLFVARSDREDDFTVANTFDFAVMCLLFGVVLAYRDWSHKTFGGESTSGTCCYRQ